MFRRNENLDSKLPVLAEVRDVDSPASARRAGVEFGREVQFAADLLRVRPWIDPDTPGREVPARLLDSEWIGFLALLDERGPWVYVQNVRELQDLTRIYSRLFQASGSLPGQAQGTSLISRLGVHSTPELEEREAEFWRRAAEFASRRHHEWLRVRR